jgi:hypothetical protein
MVADSAITLMLCRSNQAAISFIGAASNHGAWAFIADDFAPRRLLELRGSRGRARRNNATACRPPDFH